MLFCDSRNHIGQESLMIDSYKGYLFCTIIIFYIACPSLGTRLPKGEGESGTVACM